MQRVQHLQAKRIGDEQVGFFKLFIHFYFMLQVKSNILTNCYFTGQSTNTITGGIPWGASDLSDKGPKPHVWCSPHYRQTCSSTRSTGSSSTHLMYMPKLSRDANRHRKEMLWEIHSVLYFLAASHGSLHFEGRGLETGPKNLEQCAGFRWSSRPWGSQPTIQTRSF